MATVDIAGPFEIKSESRTIESSTVGPGSRGKYWLLVVAMGIAIVFVIFKVVRSKPTS